MVIKVSLPIQIEKSNFDNSITFRQFHKIDKSSLRQDLVDSDLLQNLYTSSCENLYNQYERTLQSLLDKHAPQKRQKISRQTAKWITPDFREAKRLKCLLERKWRKTRSTADRSAYRQQVNLCNRILYKGKCKFYTELHREY